MAADERLHLFIEGRVQGVFLREQTREHALRLGLTGFVRNLADGRVEVVAEGPRPVLDELAEWAEQGSPHAAVTRIETSWEEARGEFQNFRIR